MLSLFLLFLPCVLANYESDLVMNLPGVKSMPAFKIFSGYLNANPQNTKKMHYFLTESKTNPSTDPVVFWFNGGPGSSSLLGMFTENGPFTIGQNGKSLDENAYSWNARANLVALESPVQVGFSFDLRNRYSKADDDSTAEQNYQAIKNFFQKFGKKFENRRFFLTGESYAGIYIPMLTRKLVEGINSGDFPNKNFEGAAIGNGYLDYKLNANAGIVYMAYHAKVSQETWDRAKVVCRTDNETDYEKYDYHRFFGKKNSTDPIERECANIMAEFKNLNYEKGVENSGEKRFNLYHDCYKMNATAEDYEHSAGQDFEHTDNRHGFSCLSYAALEKYMNRRDVQSDFRFLIYNGDLDRVCSYIGNQWFVRDVAKNINLKSNRLKPWRFAHQVAGFQQHYEGKNRFGSRIRIDMVIVKGSGHMVPTDRPGPSRQMIVNFLFSKKDETIDYSSQKHIGPNPMSYAHLEDNKHR